MTSAFTVFLEFLLSFAVELLFVSDVLDEESVEGAFAFGRKNFACGARYGLGAGRNKTGNIGFCSIALLWPQWLELVEDVRARQEARDRHHPSSSSPTLRTHINVQNRSNHAIDYCECIELRTRMSSTLQERTPLSAVAASDTVENVLVFVADSMRYDSLPEKIRKRGVTAKAIAPSTCSHSSFPAIVSGRYPGTHQLWRETDRLPSKPELLCEEDDISVGFDTKTQYIEYDEKPPLQWIHLDEESWLGDLEPPFVHVVFDIGAHAPYGFPNGVYETRKEFFADYPGKDTLHERYRADCASSADRFLSLVDDLDERGLLERTLVMFSADHGEHLGEIESGGRFGHLYPLAPKVVDVPAVFLGAGLPENVEYPGSVSGTDIAPTALAAQGRSVPSAIEGMDLWNETPARGRRVRSEVWGHLNLAVRGKTGSADAYAAASIWDSKGGIVFHRRSPIQRAAYVFPCEFLGQSSAATRKNWTLQKQARFFRSYFSPTVTYGRPMFTPADVSESLPDTFEEQRGRFSEPNAVDYSITFENARHVLKDIRTDLVG